MIFCFFLYLKHLQSLFLIKIYLGTIHLTIPILAIWDLCVSIIAKYWQFCVFQPNITAPLVQKNRDQLDLQRICQVQISTLTESQQKIIKINRNNSRI